jgi:tetratricopeptide (TPR) repeat protein
MAELERIVKILVDNSEQFRNRSSIDMSMFPKKQVQKIYTKAAEGTFQKKDFEATATYLWLGKAWDKLLEWGVPFYHSRIDKKKEVGKSFLEVLMVHNTLPESLAIELAEDILANDGESSRCRAAIALEAGGAKTKAKEVAMELLNKGIYKASLDFLKVAGKNLSNKEREKYSEIAMQKGRYEDAFDFYEDRRLKMPHNKAKIIINNLKPEWCFDEIVKHMDENGNPFTPKEFKKFGNKFFKKGDYWRALGVYARALDSIKPEEYKIKGEKILSQSKKIESERNSYTPGEIMPSVRLAFDYLSRWDAEKAKQRITQYADDLLEKKDFAEVGPNFLQFGKIYKMAGLQIPAEKALIAAQIAEKREKYNEAAEYYIAAGMRDSAKRMGDISLQSKYEWDRIYGSKKIFQAIDDKEGIAISEFLEKNTRR